MSEVRPALLQLKWEAKLVTVIELGRVWVDLKHYSKYIYFSAHYCNNKKVFVEIGQLKYILLMSWKFLQKICTTSS